MQYEYRLSKGNNETIFLAEQRIVDEKFKTFRELKENLISNSRYKNEYDQIEDDASVERIISVTAAPIWNCSRSTL